MRGKILGVFVLALLALGFSPRGALGQEGSLTLVADVPFAFMVENTTLPAGKYEIMQTAEDPLVWTLANAKEQVKVIFFTTAAEMMKPPRSYELTFDESGGQYFLANIWLSSEKDGFALTMTKAEMAMAKGKMNPKKERVPLKKKGM